MWGADVGSDHPPSVGFSNETEVEGNIDAVSEPAESVQHYTAERLNRTSSESH